MPSTDPPRVIVRAPLPEDCVIFLAAVRRSRSLHAPWIDTKAATPAEFANYVNRFADGRHCGFLVLDRDSGGLAGVINLNEIIRGAFQSASLGYYAFEPHSGRGLMHAGMRVVLKHAFESLKLHRVEANIQPANHSSIALVRKCGFVREGLSRRLLKVRGRWRDHERWALLAEDYQ